MANENSKHAGFEPRPHAKKFDGLREYIEFTRTTAIYPRKMAFLDDAVSTEPGFTTGPMDGEHLFVVDFEAAYATLGLVGEAGEIANKVKKVYRDHDGMIPPVLAEELVQECGDMFYYFARVLDWLGVDPQEVIDQNISKLTSRKERNVLKGSGDTR